MVEHVPLKDEARVRFSQDPPGDTNRREYRAWRVAKAHRDMKRRCVEYKGGACQRCGYDKCLTSLHFHHRDGTTKEYAITSRLVRFETLKIELDKCDLLCANCHGEEHDAEYVARNAALGIIAREQVPQRRVDAKRLVVCRVCPKTFYVYASGRPNAAYCSRACRTAERRGPQPDDATLAQMFKTMSLRKISKEVHIAASALRKERRRLGIPTYAWSKRHV
jgi:hypothetical protein